MAVNQVAYELLPWDTEFFGVRIGRAILAGINEEAFATLDAWRRAENVACVYCMVEPDDRESLRTAERHGFRFVDIRIDLVKSGRSDPPPNETAALVRQAAETDLPSLRQIAREAHRDSRFYFDENFDPQRVNELFELWIEKSCRGWADHVLVLDVDGVAAGYATCHGDAGGGRIGLFALAEGKRGRGYARVLAGAAVEWLGRHRGGDVRVATQGRNAAAQRAYQRVGFVTDSVRIWYHWWPSGGKGGPE